MLTSQMKCLKNLLNPVGRHLIRQLLLLFTKMIYSLNLWVLRMTRQRFTGKLSVFPAISATYLDEFGYFCGLEINNGNN